MGMKEAPISMGLARRKPEKKIVAKAVNNRWASLEKRVKRVT
jgi:hypothetical protein